MSSDYELIKIDQAGEADVKREAHPIENSTYPIPYSDWKQHNKVSQVYNLPIEFCFFRKDNGRIKSEVLSHEKEKGLIINEKDEETQELLHKFLSESDDKQNTQLKKYLQEEGQTEPAIITADGFLVNGNRRKMALRELYETTGLPQFKKIKVCILPGTNQPERPTPWLLALLENRLQARQEGKSEYSNMNKALTAKRYLTDNVKLETLLRDDPAFNSDDKKQFEKNKKTFENRYLKPLNLMDQYLQLNGVTGNYQLVKDKWDVFDETYRYIVAKLEDINFLIENGFQEKDKSLLLQAAFNIIKLDKKRSHQIDKRRAEIIRDVFRKFSKNETKKDLLQLGAIEVGAQHGEDVVDSYHKWQDHEGVNVFNILKKLKNISQKVIDKETPLDRLEEALQKLTNERVWGVDLLKTMSLAEADKCKKVTVELERAVKRLYRLFEKFKDKEEAFKQFVKDLNENKR